MGQSICLRAFTPANEKTYIKHKNVLLACIDAEIKQLPTETAKYFGSDSPCINLLEEKLDIEIPFKEWRDSYRNGYEVYIKDIPEGVEKIRFYISY